MYNDLDLFSLVVVAGGYKSYFEIIIIVEFARACHFRPSMHVQHNSMSTLYKHLRIHQIFGANTNVGKTILTTALVRASAERGNNVFYLKPISTGPVQDADDL